MKYKIGIFGSALNEEKALLKAEALGKELSKNNVILITGVADGIPYKVAYTAFKSGTEIWGFAPTYNLKELKKTIVQQNLNIYKKLFYIPKEYPFIHNLNVCRKYRNVTSTATCDAGVIISGRWGTMNEFTNLFDMGKVIGVLTGTDGIADEIKYLMTKISKKTKAKVIISDSPKELVDKVIYELKK